MGFKRWFRHIGWRHVVGVLAVLFAAFPLIWVLSAAFTEGGTLSGQKLIPDHPSLGNFRTLMSAKNHPPFWHWFANSMIVGLATAAITVFFSALAAFAFSRLRFKGRRPAMLTLLLVQMFPSVLALVAVFILMLQVKKLFPGIGLGTLLGLMIVYLGGALGVNTWLMKGFFDTIPMDLDEAAKIDGATHAQTFFKVILPLGRPVLAVIGLLSFIGIQADFITADVIIGPKIQNRTLAVGLSRYILAGFDSQWGPFAAGALLGAVPTVVIFLFLQRFIVSGLTSGAVKG
jgi:arabinogalactan oligomer / maltooligosaccharide transport system permease protein